MLLALLYTFCAIGAVADLLLFFSGSEPSFAPLIRLGLTVAVAYFVFKGSFAARVIMALLSALAALVTAYFAVELLAEFDVQGAVIFSILAGFYTLAAWALFRSPPIQAYWASLQSGAPPSGQS